MNEFWGIEFINGLKDHNHICNKYFLTNKFIFF